MKAAAQKNVLSEDEGTQVRCDGKEGIDPSELLTRVQILASEFRQDPDLADEAGGELLYVLIRRGLQKLSSIDPGKLDSYLRRGLKRWRATMWSRKARRLRKEKKFARQASAPRQSPAGEEIERKELWVVVIEILCRYAAGRTEQVFSLWMKGASEEEIGKEIGQSKSTVRQVLARAKRILRRRLPEYGFSNE